MELKSEVPVTTKTIDEFSSKKKDKGSLKILRKNCKSIDINHKMTEKISESLYDSKINRDIGYYFFFIENICTNYFFCSRYSRFFHNTRIRCFMHG